jgi:sorbitol-specific phosphotransferase system component IIA
MHGAPRRAPSDIGLTSEDEDAAHAHLGSRLALDGQHAIISDVAKLAQHLAPLGHLVSEVTEMRLRDSRLHANALCNSW